MVSTMHLSALSISKDGNDLAIAKTNAKATMDIAGHDGRFSLEVGNIFYPAFLLDGCRDDLTLLQSGPGRPRASPRGFRAHRPTFSEAY
jgi:hypothetical protein